MKKILSSFVIISAMTTSAFAMDTIFKPYVGIDFSNTWIDTGTNNDATLGSIGGRVGIDIIDYFGVEGRVGTGVMDDDIDGVNVELNHYIAGFAKIQTPDMNGFRVHGLAGIARVELEASAGGLTGTAHDTDFAYGAGLSYAINQNIRLNLEYLSLNEDADTANLGVTYHF